MKRESARRRSGICAAAATAVSAVGISLMPVSMLPVAHAACEDWILGPTVWEFAFDNGALIETYGWSGKTMTKTPGGKPAFAEWFPPGGGDKTEGPATGSINGRAITVTANWVTGPGAGGPDTFSGTIDDNGVASGTLNGMGWHSTDKVKCAPAPAANPAPAAPAAPATPAQSVTVLKESTVYDSKGGNEIGEGFFLPVGSTFNTGDPCADNWCLLKIPDLPGGAHGQLSAGFGWVYSGIDSGENFLKLN
jgi:hypothetical protein